MTATTAANYDKRLRILSPDEIKVLYGRPTFSAEDRDVCFTLSPVEKGARESFHSIKSRLYFILQLGYVGRKAIGELRGTIGRTKARYWRIYHVRTSNRANESRSRISRFLQLPRWGSDLPTHPDYDD